VLAVNVILERWPRMAARGRAASRDDAKPQRHLAVGKNGVEAGRALFDERCFPILVQQMESAGRDAAGGGVRSGVSEAVATAWVGPTGVFLADLKTPLGRRTIDGTCSSFSAPTL
jgi:hypothetical protein